MSRAPIAIQLLGRLGRLVVAGWAHRCGISLAAAAAVAAGVGASLLAVSVGAALWLRATRAYEDEALGAGALAVAIVLMLFLGGMLVSVVVQGAGSTLTPAARSLTALPIRTRLLALGLGLPGVGLTVAVFLVAAPPAIVVLDGATGYGPGHALVTAATSFVLGALVGRAAFTALRRLLARSGRLAPLTLSAAVGGWLAVCALSAWAADGVLESGLDSA